MLEENVTSDTSASTDDFQQGYRNRFLAPRREPGRLTLIARMGAQKVGERLPPLVEAVRAAGPGRAHRLHQRRQALANLLRAHPRDQRQAPRLAARVAAGQGVADLVGAFEAFEQRDVQLQADAAVAFAGADTLDNSQSGLIAANGGIAIEARQVDNRAGEISRPFARGASKKSTRPGGQDDE